MTTCPNCNSEVKPDERFCGNCGARLDPTPPGGTAAPERPLTGKETVVLPALTETSLRPPAPPAPRQPAADPTIVSLPPSMPPPMAEPGPAPAGSAAPTIMGVPAPTAPAAGYPSGTLPPAAAAPVAQKSGGSSVLKVLAIIAGVGVLACAALGIGGYLLLGQLGRQVGSTFQTINSGLLETAAAGSPAGVGAGAGAVLFADSLDSAASSKLTESDDETATTKFVDGTYEITAHKPSWIVWKPVGDEYGDAAISADTTIVGTKQSSAGLMFHYQDDKNFYMFSISADGRYNLELYKDDQLTTLIDWIEASAIKAPGEVNALRVETAGDKIRLFANGTLLDEISDGSIARGRAGLAVSSFKEGGVTARFDNLTIQAIK